MNKKWTIESAKKAIINSGGHIDESTGKISVYQNSMGLKTIGSVDFLNSHYTPNGVRYWTVWLKK